MLPVCTGVLFHEYEYGIVPPATVTDALPVPPKQTGFVDEDKEDVSCAGCVTGNEIDSEHPFWSTTFTVYEPALRLVNVGNDEGTGDQE